MRLMWAGLLVLLPLVAELANAQKCYGEPDAPEHATIRCFKKRGTCRAMCQSGYRFQGKGSMSAIYTCVGGQWEMKNGHEDRCSPVCDPPCRNGECIEPDTCVCDRGFTGYLCDEEEYDEDYATEEATAGYDDNAYGYDDNEDNDEDEGPIEEYEESEEIEVVEAEPEAEPEAELEPEADAENEEDEVALYFRSLEQSVKNWDTSDRRRLVHKFQMVFYKVAEAIDGRQQPPPCAAITT